MRIKRLALIMILVHDVIVILSFNVFHEKILSVSTICRYMIAYLRYFVNDLIKTD
jgi:hypothetical protein